MSQYLMEGNDYYLLSSFKDPEKRTKTLIGLIPSVFTFIGVLYALNMEGARSISDSLPGQSWMIALFAAVMVRLYTWATKKDPKDYSKKNVEYGSASFGNAKDIKPFVDPNPDNNVVLTATESLTMNPRPTAWEFARNKNIIVVGGSGAGKTRGYMKPNLMNCESKDFPVSYIITDPKGGLLTECGKMLHHFGYEIKTLNLIDFKKSMKYNPFKYVKTEKDILKLVNVLMQNTDGDGKGGDDFWRKAEQLLYCALIGYIHFEAIPEQRNMNTMVFLIQNMETREEEEDFENAVDLLFKELENGNEAEGIKPQPDHFAVRQYKSYKLAAGKTAKSILISCAARLAPFDIQEVRDLMSEDNMELDKLGGYHDYNPKTGKYDLVVKRKTALFVIIPDTDTTFNFIVGMLYSQMFNILCDIADNEFNGRLPVHVRGLFDEFANIGSIPNFDKLIATIRSREISATIVLQSITQLKTLYKDSWEVIIGNCDTNLFLGGKETSTLKEWAETLGKQTIDIDNDSQSFGQSKSSSRSSQKLARDLMSIDEIAVMRGNKCLLHIRGARPFFSNKYDVTKHKNYKYLMDANPKNEFDVVKYMKGKSTKLTIKENEEIILMVSAA